MTKAKSTALLITKGLILGIITALQAVISVSDNKKIIYILASVTVGLNVFSEGVDRIIRVKFKKDKEFANISVHDPTVVSLQQVPTIVATQELPSYPYQTFPIYNTPHEATQQRLFKEMSQAINPV